MLRQADNAGEQESSMKSGVTSCVTVLLALSGTAVSAQTYKSSAGSIAAETVVTGLTNPWAFVFLPDGRLLVTERPGRMRIASAGKLSPPLPGVPKVYAV